MYVLQCNAIVKNKWKTKFTECGSEEFFEKGMLRPHHFTVYMWTVKKPPTKRLCPLKNRFTN